MEINASNSQLKEIDIERIVRNEDNPRILFRQGELEELLESIRIYGVQVPIALYRDGNKYVLLDGERRWICCQKLNKRTIPALIQKKPSRLQNLLLMFNIHSLREQWDLLTQALKLPEVIALIEKETLLPPTERELSRKTGLAVGTIRRCKLLMELPKKYKDIILSELQKPKPQQKLTEDFFIEMERSLKTVERNMPGLMEDKNKVRDVLIKKYRNGVINNVLSLRKLPKIAKAEKVSADKQRALDALLQVFEDNDYSIDGAFENSVSDAYLEQNLQTRIRFLIEKLESFDDEEFDDELKKSLQLLFEKLKVILEA